ncbi:flippase [Mucilaginibacter celer]|uniref:Flippase n=1 Tax=Mucilaginibacter celer TaxID=2305508 RepID=A0A494VM07_9SPHI|nr:flippase [Mucilaginibacter celer]AYL95129.1 flippase [Mucilaginibacter celer]
MSEQKHLIKNIFSLGIVQVANYVLPLISIPIVVRIIGPDSFGVINYYSSFVAYFMLLINYGFDYSGTRFIAIERDNAEKRNLHFTKVLYAKSILFAVSTLIFFGALTFVSHSYNESKVAIYTFLIAISWVITPNWFYQGMQKLTQVALFNFLSKLLFNVLIVVIIRQKSYYIWQPLILSLSQILVSAISLQYAIRHFKIKLLKVPFKTVLDLLWEDRMIFFSMLATNLYTDTNIVILGFYETKEHIGYFTAAWRLMFVFLVLLSLPTSQAMFPYIAESFSKNINKGIEQIKRMLPIVIYASLGFSAVLYLAANLIIHGFYGKNFDATVVIFRILTIVPVLSFINTVLGLQTMVNLKMDKAYFTIVFSGGLFSVIFNIIIINFYGYVGCAWSWIIAETLIALVLNRYLSKKGYKLFVPGYFNPLAIADEMKTLIVNFKKGRSAKISNNNQSV